VKTQTKAIKSKEIWGLNNDQCKQAVKKITESFICIRREMFFYIGTYEKGLIINQPFLFIKDVI
jgi:hypothetical protein